MPTWLKLALTRSPATGSVSSRSMPFGWRRIDAGSSQRLSACGPSGCTTTWSRSLTIMILSGSWAVLICSCRFMSVRLASSTPIVRPSCGRITGVEIENTSCWSDFAVKGAEKCV